MGFAENAQKMSKAVLYDKRVIYWLVFCLISISVLNIISAFQKKCCDEEQQMARDFTKVNLFTSGFVIAFAVWIGYKTNKELIPQYAPYGTVGVFFLLCLFTWFSNGKDECKHMAVWAPSLAFGVSVLGVGGYAFLNKKELMAT